MSVVLVAFLVAWLNLAMQPCLLAMELPAEPITETGHPSHSSHSNGQYCGHCPSALDNGHRVCALSAASACGVTLDFDVDARSKLPKFEDTSTFVVIAESPPIFEFVLRKNPVRSPDPTNLSYPTAPPLYVRHCVFLK